MTGNESGGKMFYNKNNTSKNEKLEEKNYILTKVKNSDTDNYNKLKDKNNGINIETVDEKSKIPVSDGKN